MKESEVKMADRDDGGTQRKSYAHSKEGCPISEWQPLEDHLRQVAEMAAGFAASFQSADWAWNAGWLHDLGKIDPTFQSYLLRANGLTDPDYGREGAGKVNHSSAGGALAEQRFSLPFGRVLAYLSAGHHAGLPDFISPESPLAELRSRLAEGADNLGRIRDRVDEYTGLLKPLTKPPPFVKPDSFHLWVRMLFSCLVDADFLDTEQFMDPQRGSLRAGFLPLSQLKGLFDAYMEEKLAHASASPVNAIRAQVLSQCRAVAKDPPGLYSLTVPTGGGKTLSALAFALEHALIHGLNRIVYVIPYTSIIEQTARELRHIFGDDQVVEHHSSIDTENETPQAMMAAENWDAPVIVTTNVQFFESLYASRSSRCRKLHNLSRSVVILDEAQMIPPQWLSPCVRVINQLVAHFGVSMLLATATQPALPGILPAREIVPDREHLYAGLIRTEIRFPEDFSSRSDWPSLAAELTGYEQVLCVVNTRRDCHDLYRAMPPGTIHLSALMCGEHRSRVIATIKARLQSNQPVRVISTQLVEAGVDIDFPVVYRAMAGLDSIAQAAGRCNREGKLNESGRLGQVRVFVPPKDAPVGLLRKGETACRIQAQMDGFDPQCPAEYARYFEQFYASLNDDGEKWYRGNLVPDDREYGMNLRTVGYQFKLIDDQAREPVLVAFGGNDSLLETLRNRGPSRDLLRRLQRSMVNLSRRDFAQAGSNGLLEEVSPGFWLWRGAYTEELGLDLWGAGWTVEDLVV